MIQSLHLLTITLLYPLTLTQSQQSNPHCDANAIARYRTTSNGCSYPACAPTPPLPGGNTTAWRCVHDSRFCNGDEFFVPASEVARSNRECTCRDILGYPSLIGVCNVSGYFLPMLTEEDCEGGTPVCESESTDMNGDSTFLVGWKWYPKTACDLKCEFEYGHVVEVPQNTYHGCNFPKFEWTTASSGPHGSMQAHQLEVLGDKLYVGGSLSIADKVDDGTTLPITLNFQLKGPYTADDPTASNGYSIYQMVREYGEDRPYECAIATVNKVTGEPIDVLSLVGPGACYINAMGRDAAGAILVAGGHHIAKGKVSVPTSLCTPVVDGEGGSFTSCSNDGRTTVRAHDSADTAHVLYTHPDGVVRWLIQPWLNLSPKVFDRDPRARLRNDEPPFLNNSPKKSDQTVTMHESSITGISVDDEGDVYLTGYRANMWTSQPTPVYCAMLTKLSGVNGSVIWEKELVGAKHTLNSAYDSDGDALFVTAEVLAGEKVEALGITCDPEVDEIEGCNVLMKIGAEDGTIHWVRYAYGYLGSPFNVGHVQVSKHIIN